MSEKKETGMSIEDSSQLDEHANSIKDSNFNFNIDKFTKETMESVKKDTEKLTEEINNPSLAELRNSQLTIHGNQKSNS